MPLDDGNGGWGEGPDSFPATNILRIYRPEDTRAKNFIAVVDGAGHEGRIFIHDKCTGRRASYTSVHVNQLLTASENPERIKERIVELIPKLPPQQMQWLTEGISADALAVVASMDGKTADMIRARKASAPMPTTNTDWSTPSLTR